jgi:hypothetical protein
MEGRFLFQGDGLYPGDGGAELQRLWSHHNWRALGGCDGRFVQRGKALSQISLPELCSQWRVAVSSPAICCCDASADDGDSVWCVRFRGGGGLLTYAKPDGVFVHTLNTESGLCRKLVALHGRQLNASAPDERLARAMESPHAALLFQSCCSLLRWIPEPERTSAAPAAAVALRLTVARGSVRPHALPPAMDQTQSSN